MKDEKENESNVSVNPNPNPPITKPSFWSLNKLLLITTIAISFLQTDPGWEFPILLTTSLRDLILSSWCVLYVWFSKQFHSSQFLSLQENSAVFPEDESCSIGNQTIIETENIPGWCNDPNQGILMPDVYMIFYLAGQGLLQGLMNIAILNLAIAAGVLFFASSTIYRVIVGALSIMISVIVMRYAFTTLSSVLRALWHTPSFVYSIKLHLKTKPIQATGSSITNDKAATCTDTTGQSESDVKKLPLPPKPKLSSSFPFPSLLKSFGAFVDELDGSGADMSSCTLQSTNKITLSDYKGGSEAKKELELVVGFLKHPQKFHDIGARLPHGILLYGPPGTGKTLFARVLAGEAGVQFIHKCASEFRSMFVGSGARNIRQAFDTARKMAPCILFIDEIDSISRRTDSSFHPYANQAINQLLHEMDGFVQNDSNIIVVGATNRLDNIDKALLRPGRFDKTVYVGYPDVVARKEIMELYVGRLKKVGEIHLDKIAAQTDGFSGAELENLINQAAITAVMKEAEKVEHEHVEIALRDGKKSQEKMEDYDSINPNSGSREAIKHMYN